MANTVVRPCVVCNTLMETQRASKQTCSDKCSKQHYRAQQRQKQTIEPNEEIAMTKAAQQAPKQNQLFQPDPVQLKKLQDFEVSRYNSNVQCDIQGREQLGRFETFDVQGLQQGLDQYVALAAEGYTVSTDVAHYPKIVTTPTCDWLMITMQKPVAQQQADIAKILVETEQSYTEHLAELKKAAVSKEVESLLAGERRKKLQVEQEAKEQEERDAYARVEAEVLAALGGKQ